MEMNVEKSKMIGISKQASPIHMMVDQTQPENMEYLNYVRSIITNDARCTQEVKSRISIANAFQQEEGSFRQKFGLNLRKKQLECRVSSIGLYGARTWTLRKVHQRCLECFET